MTPAKDVIVSIPDAEERNALVIVNNDNLSQAIGKKGSNIKLASKLTKYHLEIKTMEEIQFNHTLPIQLRFNDVDKFGHVNNTVYFSFYDLGKTEYFASVCPDVDWEKDGIVVVHIEANFLAQIYGSDHIAVQTAVTEIGTKSFHLAQRVIDTETQEVKCVCTSVMVAFDLAKHESKPLEEKWIEAICKYEGKDLKKKK